MRFNKYYFEKFLERHKIARNIYIGIIAIIGVIFAIAIFSWDSLLGWIITKEKSYLHAFVFWAILAVVVLIAAIVITLNASRKKK